MYEYVCMNIDVMNMYEYVRMNIDIRNIDFCMSIDVRVPSLIAGTNLLLLTGCFYFWSLLRQKN